MVAFPRRGLRISKTNGILFIQMTDNPNDENFKYMAHSKGSMVKDILYISSFLGRVVNTKLRSLPEAPWYSETLTSFRTWAKNNGTGYEIINFYQLLYIQCMYLLKYKNLNSQSTIGQGIVNINNTSSPSNGAGNMGMDSEVAFSSYPAWKTNGTSSVCLFGLMNLWGNRTSWLDGIMLNTANHLLMATENYNDTGTGYTDMGEISEHSGYMIEPIGSTELGLICNIHGGSETTNFCDYQNIWSSSTVSSIGQYGSAVDRGGWGGIFGFFMDNAITYKYYTTARMIFL